MNRRPLDEPDDVDWVAVNRAIHGRPVGRPLHHAEKVHIAKNYPELNMAEQLGVSGTQAREYRKGTRRD